VDGLEEALDLVVLFSVEGCYFALLARVGPGQLFRIEDPVAQVEGIHWNLTIHPHGWGGGVVLKVKQDADYRTRRNEQAPPAADNLDPQLSLRQI